MTTETRKRIRAYKKMLPELRERVIAVALLLAMSASMLGSASFAWITLSRSPEVSGMSTTVAANGNLEIALAQGSAKDPAEPPRESAVGDSSAAEGQNIVGANVTWGNLVNVSDPTYGLSKIALRPALLSAYNRTDYPLNGATYGGDGRVVSTNDRYEFASYTKLPNDGYFAAGDKANYGVRAISSVKYENVQGNARIDIYSKETDQLYREAQAYYKKVVADTPNEVNTLDEAGGVTCISALEGLVQVFAQDQVNEMMGSGTKSSCSPYLWHLYQMMLLLEEAMELEGKAILEMANWQAYIASGNDIRENTFASIDTLLSYSTADLQNRFGVKIDTLTSYKSNLNTLRNKCIAAIYPLAKKCQNPDAPEQQYYWDDIASIVNELVHINSATLNGVELNGMGLGSISSVTGSSKNKRYPVVAKKGLLVEMERRFVTQDSRVQADVYAYVKALGMKVEVYGTVYTQAYIENYTADYTKDMSYSEGLQSGAKGEPVAKDTYGLALDLWVRTNYPSAVLTLEGSAKYEDQRATAKIDGTTYELYTITVGSGETQMERDIYKKADAEGAEKWFYVDNPTMEVVAEDMGDQTPKEKMIPVIVGYEGENRVWEDWRDLLESGYIEQDATTQGAGSCFVFYADTPTEQAKIMEMLEAFNVAFMDQNGDILGTAKLNLGSAYANQGKVTVPLEVETGTEYTDEAGVTHKGLTTLTQNTPTMITAVVYLNGSDLKNENVLADGELQGQLNIQFGTDSTLIAPKDEELQQQARTITATVSINGQSGTDGYIGGEQGFDYKAGGYPTTVTLTVDGDQPQRIKGFFVRVINDTQGTRGDEVEFTKNADGKWTGNFTLTNPGTYAFNTLLVDGVQYTLHDGTQKSGLNEYYPSNRPYIYIKGLKVSSATVDVAPGTYMTADTSKAFPVKVGIDAAVPVKQVTAQFFSTDEGNSKQYSAILTYDNASGLWTGTANISSSGTYTLKYIVVDGQTLDAPSSGTYTLYLGLTARVSTSVPAANRTYTYDEDESKQLEMLVNIYDDNHEAIPNLTGVLLYYNNILSPAEMKWENNRYEGTLDATEAGEMTFQKILTPAGDISNVQNAPVFKAIDENPTTLESCNDAEDKVTVIGKTTPATMSVKLGHGKTATVWAKMVNSEGGDSVYVKGTHSTADQNDIVFDVPMVDGTWTITKLLLQECFDSSYRWYDATWTWNGQTGTKPTEATEIDGLVFELVEAQRELMTTKIVASYNVVVTAGGIEKTYSSTDNISSETMRVNLTPNGPGVLLADHSTGDIIVKITDDDGDPIDVVTAGTLEMQHDANTTSKYGYYTGATGSKINFTASASNGVVTFSGVTLNHAGEYNTNVFKVTVGGSEVELKVKPKFTISSAKPTVTVASISPAAGTTNRIYTVSNPDTAGQLTTGDFFRRTNNSATVYLYTPQNDHLTVTKPEVTLSLSGIASGYTNASMTFDTKNANSVGSTFSFGSGTTATASIGKATNGSSSWSGDTFPVLYPAGKMTQGTLTLEYVGSTLVATLSGEITIEQPQSPAIVNFTGIPDSYKKDDKPTQIVGDGSTVTVTLPKLTWTETIERSADSTATWTDYTAVETIAAGKIYGYKEYKTKDLFIFTTQHKDYQYYEWTHYQSSYTGTVNKYEQDKQIATWIIDGERYPAGKEVTLTREGIITVTAEVRSVGEERLVDTVEQTSYKDLYGYAKGEEVKDQEVAGYFGHTASGTKIGSTVTSSSSAYPSPKLAVPSSANANTDTIGTNMTANSGDYQQYWP